MKKKTIVLLFSITLIFCVSVGVIFELSNFRIYQKESCTYYTDITYVTFFSPRSNENLTGTLILVIGNYRFCGCHQNAVAYGYYITRCLGDNGTHLVTPSYYVNETVIVERFSCLGPVVHEFYFYDAHIYIYCVGGIILVIGILLLYFIKMMGDKELFREEIRKKIKQQEAKQK